MEEKEFEQFDKTDKRLLEQLREQATQICRFQISPKWMEGSLNDFRFGFLHKTPIAQVGKIRRTRHTSYSITSFILCKPYSTNNIEIKLLCSRSKKKQGEQLLKVVETYARNLGMSALSLSSLPEKKLIDWYKSQGFQVDYEIKDLDTYELKGYYMKKFLRQTIS